MANVIPNPKPEPKQPDPGPSKVQAQAEIKAEQQRLERIEATREYGAPVLTPKAQLLNAKEAEAANPDHRVRWVNIASQETVQSRLIQGYERIPEADGGRQLGTELALFRIPRPAYEARVRAQERMNKERLEAHKSAVQEVVLGVVKELRDKHGIQVDERRLFVNE